MCVCVFFMQAANWVIRLFNFVKHTNIANTHIHTNNWTLFIMGYDYNYCSHYFCCCYCFYTLKLIVFLFSIHNPQPIHQRHRMYLILSFIIYISFASSPKTLLFVWFLSLFSVECVPSVFLNFYRSGDKIGDSLLIIKKLSQTILVNNIHRCIYHNDSKNVKVCNNFSYTRLPVFAFLAVFFFSLWWVILCMCVWLTSELNTHCLVSKHSQIFPEISIWKKKKKIVPIK